MAPDHKTSTSIIIHQPIHHHRQQSTTPIKITATPSSSKQHVHIHQSIATTDFLSHHVRSHFGSSIFAQTILAQAVLAHGGRTAASGGDLVLGRGVVG